MLKVYFDNDVASAISRRDLEKGELDAIDQVLVFSGAGRIAVGTSRHSTREMERAPSQHQRKLKEALSGLELAEDDHRLLGFFTQTDQHGGCVANPLVTDIVDAQVYSHFTGVGLRTDDAKHVMYAVQNGYDRFLTCDNGILSRRLELEKLCPSLRIQKPSELVGEIAALGGCEGNAIKTEGNRQ